MVSTEQLKLMLHYDPDMGIWTWLVSPCRAIPAGSRAGYFNNGGYRLITINRKPYLSSHLAIFYMTGKWPNKTVDHIDTNPSNDKWSNLREASHQEQARNRRKRRDSDLPKWVKRTRNENRFEARIWHGKLLHLGTFDTPEQAHDVAAKFARSIHGNFYNKGK